MQRCREAFGGWVAVIGLAGLADSGSRAARPVLIEFGGLPGTGKSTLAKHLAARTGAVLLRLDEIESGMRRNGLTAQQTGIAAYSVAHDIAISHLRRGLTVIVDAVSPVEEARAGWRELARAVGEQWAGRSGARHLVIEVQCPDQAEHRRRVLRRAGGESDLPGWVYPGWDEVQRRRLEYQPRTDERLVVDTTLPPATCHQLVADHVGSWSADSA